MKHRSWCGIILATLFMEAYGCCEFDKIAYDDLVAFIAFHPETGRNSTMSIDDVADSYMLSDEEEAFINQMFGNASFRRDCLNFLGHLFTRYDINPNERTINIRIQFDHWGEEASVIDRDDVQLLRCFLWGDDDRNPSLHPEYESFFNVFHAVMANPGPYWEDRVLNALEAAAGTMVFEAFQFICPDDKWNRLMKADTIKWICSEDLLGRFLSFVPVDINLIGRISTYFSMRVDESVKAYMVQILKGPNRDAVIQVWKRLFDENYVNGECLLSMGCLIDAAWKMKGRCPQAEAEKLLESTDDRLVALGIACLMVQLDHGDEVLWEGRIAEKLLEVLRNDKTTVHCAAATLVSQLVLVCETKISPSLLDDAIFVNAAKRTDFRAEEELLSLLPLRNRGYLLDEELRRELTSRYQKLYSHTLQEEFYSGYGEISYVMLTNLGVWETDLDKLTAFEKLTAHLRTHKDEVDFHDMKRFQYISDGVHGVMTGEKEALKFESIDITVAERLKEAVQSKTLSPAVSEEEALEVITCLRFFPEAFTTEEEARSLLSRPLEAVDDPYIVCMWFYFQLIFGLAADALALCKEHLHVMLRPNWLPIYNVLEDNIEELGTERAWALLMGKSGMNRLTFAIRVAQLRGQNELVEQFVQDPQLSNYINLDAKSGLEESLVLLHLRRGIWYGLDDSFFYDSRYDVSYGPIL